MTDRASHQPVLLDEVLHWLEPREGGLYVDGTFGAGGYSRAVLGIHGTRVLGIDRDPTALAAAGLVKRAHPGRFAFAEGPFSVMEEIVEQAEGSGVDGVMLDLGVSSMQLDQAERGFSFQNSGPLDMRMSRSGPSAADAVNGLDEVELAAVFRVYGDERKAGRAAHAVVRERSEAPIETTDRLAAIIARAVGGKTGRTHPATRVFQALRILVNDELGELARGLVAAERILKPAGRLVVVTFHSLEDRMVKMFLRERAGLTPGGSRHVPEIKDERAPSFSLLTRKAVAPGEAELEANPRARSAKLRAGARTGSPAWAQSIKGAFGAPGFERLLEVA
ncbi:MAG: 16S rRNA (cytosine(1402)-N(4))-methyltransferase RsmH [Pseudomonadota bacterium]